MAPSPSSVPVPGVRPRARAAAAVPASSAPVSAGNTGGSWAPCSIPALTALPAAAYTGFRLGNGSSGCSGRVEVAVRGTWGSVCASEWDLPDAHVLCRHLGCGRALSVPPGGSFGNDMLEKMESPAANNSFEEMVVVCSSGCPEKGWRCRCPKQPPQPGPSVPAGSRRVRLVGSSGRCAGRVEVYSGGSWSSVCQEGWDLQDAAVVCRELGCGRALEAPSSARFGGGTGPLWPYMAECSGSEESLWECGRSEERECGRGVGAGAVCSGQWRAQISVRLAGGRGRCRGSLEVSYNGTWGRVCSNGTSTGTAGTVCRQLGCGERGWLSADTAQQPSHAWLAWVGCEDGARSFWECPSRPGDGAMRIPCPCPSPGDVCPRALSPAGVVLHTESTPACPSLQENNSWLGIFIDFIFNFSFFVLKS
uniref:SRCR domain-containing protein n=1 Tax=Catharus ustulatus TaxID=91951 RepID=A0A8C3VE93_CATUS